jgi:hypothetical protein
VIKIVYFILICISTSYASSDNHYDEALITSITRILSEINEEKISFCKNLEPQESETYNNCSRDERKKVESRQFEAYNLITSWISKIKEYEKKYEIKKITKTIRRGTRVKKKVKISELTIVAKKLKCISRKINNAKFKCKSDVKACKQGAWAYTLPIINTKIHLCPNFWQGKDHEVGMIIHELAHKCAATDSNYFNYRSNSPKSSRSVHWANIADTYEYWAQFGFCIPGVDC